MFCSDCGAENKSTAKFCEQCGKSLARAPLVSTGEKPLGLVIVVILSALSGIAELALGSVFALIPDLMGLATSGLIAIGVENGLDASMHITSLKIAGIGAGLFASGVLTLAAAYGLWNFIGWGRVLAVALYGIGLFVGVILFFTTLGAGQTAGSIALQLLGFAVGVWVLVYLFRPNIRDLFHGLCVSRDAPTSELKAQVQNQTE
jgi:uncharacterized membrane protein (DUF2068 family)